MNAKWWELREYYKNNNIPIVKPVEIVVEVGLEEDNNIIKEVNEICESINDQYVEGFFDEDIVYEDDYLIDSISEIGDFCDLFEEDLEFSELLSSGFIYPNDEEDDDEDDEDIYDQLDEDEDDEEESSPDVYFNNFIEQDNNCFETNSLKDLSCFLNNLNLKELDLLIIKELNNIND